MLGRSSGPLIEGKQGGDLAVCYCGSRARGQAGRLEAIARRAKTDEVSRFMCALCVDCNHAILRLWW